jgi:hypothetical protein
MPVLNREEANMRRLLWGAAGVALIGGVGVYVVAAYAVLHPNSGLGRQTAAVFGLVARISPMRLLQPKQPVGADREAIVDACCEPAPAAGAASGDPLQDQEMMAFIRSFPSSVHLDAETGVKPIDQRAAKAANVSQDSNDAAGEEEFDEDAPRFMPPIGDDDDKAPATMPYACRYADEEEPPIGFVEVRTRKVTPAPNREEGAAEESEIPFDKNLSNCQEDPNYQYQYPGCPYTGPNPATRSSKPSNLDDPRGRKKNSPLDIDRLRGKSNTYGAGEEQEEPGAHSDIDTMEFRPTDARKDEFKKRIQ